MKPRELVLAGIGLVLLLGAAFLLPSQRSLGLEEEVFRAGDCRIWVRTLGPQDAKASAVVLHGLSSNARIMQFLGAELASAGLRVYLVDLPGHGDNEESFTYDRAETCAANFLDKLDHDGRIRADKTVLIGHSMGGSIVIRMADRFPTAATISLGTSMRMPVPGSDPVPLELPRRVPVNLLLITGKYDFARSTGANERLLAAAEGQRYAEEDFRQRRAVRLMNLPGATHTNLIFNIAAIAAALDWIHSSLPAKTQSENPAAAIISVLLAGAGLLALAMMFPFVASTAAQAFRALRSETIGSRTSFLRTLLAWGVCSLLAIFFLRAAVPLRPVVQMYTGDYLASVLMLVGIVFLLMKRIWAQQAAPLQAHWGVQAVITGGVLGLATMLAFGAWLDWQITDMWLNGPRWWRFAVLVPLVLPYFVAEELALGTPEAQWPGRLRRFMRFVMLRTLLWLAMLLGIVWLHSGQVLIVLLVIYLAAFSIAQRVGMDGVRRRTGSATAAAVYGAILAAWFIAAAFPIT